MWITITEAHLLNRLSGTELGKLRGAALAAGQADPVQPTIDEVTAYVRGFVGRRFTLGDGNTIPLELLRPALALIVMEFIARVAGINIDPKGERKAEADQAQKVLDSVADGRIAIETPTRASGATIGNPSPRFSAPDLAFSPDSQDGL